jgi:spore maturation protein CgeB
LSLSAMYQGYLDAFYNRNIEIDKMQYDTHLNFLLEDSTEFVGSYLRNFRKVGIDAECVIANDKILQTKWGYERGFDGTRHEEILFEQVKLSNPDVLWVENLSLVSYEWLTRVRIISGNLRLVVGYHCAPLNKKVLDSLRGIDLMITCTPGLKSEFENLGKKTFLVYHGFDKDLLQRLSKMPEIPQNDFVFSGSLISGGDFHSKRTKLIERIIKENINLQLYVNLEKDIRIRAKQSIYLFTTLAKNLKMGDLVGKFKFLNHGKTWVDTYSNQLKYLNRNPVYGIEMYNLFLHSRIVLNYHIGVAGEYAGNMRMFEVTGVGSCLLTDNKKNMHELFDTENEVVTYDGEDDCIEKVRWLMEHEDERKKIAKCGNQKTLSSHTVENRCALIYEILNSELNISVR